MLTQQRKREETLKEHPAVSNRKEDCHISWRLVYVCRDVIPDRVDPGGGGENELQVKTGRKLRASEIENNSFDRDSHRVELLFLILLSLILS